MGPGVDAVSREVLLGCLPVPRWADAVLAGRPYADPAALLTVADEAARSLTDEELEQALAGHPRIGERATSGHNAEASRREQAGVDPASGDTAARLVDGNVAYETRFGHGSLRRPAGRDGADILAEQQPRLGHA